MERHNIVKNPSIDEIFDVDNEIRAKSRELFLQLR